MEENSNDGGRKLGRDKVWSANKVNVVCRKYTISIIFISQIL